MENVSLIDWLAEGPLWVFAIIIGLLVSFDVAVVEITRSYPKNETAPKLFGVFGPRAVMALAHASLHAGSFILYMCAILLLQTVPVIAFEFFNVPPGVSPGFFLLFTSVIFGFVWWTYKDKIAEDHSEKDDTKPEDVRYDMRLLVNFFRAILSKLGIARYFSGIMVAGTVAVDMLAVSAILKTWLLPIDDKPPLSSWTGIIIVDLLIFGSLIFVCVMAMVILAQGAHAYLSKASTFFAAFFRFVEPLVIFFIMGSAIRVLSGSMGLELPKTPIFLNTIASDWFFALSMTFSLFVANWMGPHRFYELALKRSEHDPSDLQDIPFKQILNDYNLIIEMIAWFVIVLSLIILSLILAFSTGEDHNHLVEATAFFAASITLIIAIFLYLPLGGTQSLEDRFLNGEFGSSPSWSEFVGTAVALGSVILYIYINFDSPLASGALVMWSGYIVFTWFLINLRIVRFASARQTSPEKVSFDSTEFLSAIGLASALVAMLGTYLSRETF